MSKDTVKDTKRDSGSSAISIFMWLLFIIMVIMIVMAVYQAYKGYNDAFPLIFFTTVLDAITSTPLLLR